MTGHARMGARVAGTASAAMADTSCDTLVILGPHTRDGYTLFAKNSDRPPDECQPLFRVPRVTHPLCTRAPAQSSIEAA